MMLEPNAEVNGVACVSLRDENWEDARSVLLYAIAAGYHHWVMDDGVLLFMQPVAYDHLVNVEDPTASLQWARVWWQIDE